MPRLVLRKGKRAASFDCQLGGVVGGVVSLPTRGLEAGVGSVAAIVVCLVWWCWWWREGGLWSTEGS